MLLAGGHALGSKGLSLAITPSGLFSQDYVVCKCSQLPPSKNTGEPFNPQHTLGNQVKRHSRPLAERE